MKSHRSFFSNAKVALFFAAGLAAQAQSGDMSYLDNGKIRIGVDLSLGGVITYLSAEAGENIINSADLGRQIQQSYYSGPRPYGEAAPAWKNWPWNPIGTGDYYHNRAKVIARSNNGKVLYTKSIPMQWALNNVPCECTFESWIELEGNVAKVRARLNNNRPDHTQYKAYDQELPAVYTNGTHYHLVTYDGEEPFTGAPIREVKTVGPPAWNNWVATENWAALLNDAGQGLGVFHPDVFQLKGGFAGKPGAGGPKDGPTGYISPIRQEILDYNIQYAYEYRLIVGDLTQIREYVYAHRPVALPDYHFQNNRLHWIYADASDAGYPIKGMLRVRLDGKAPRVIGPPGFWKAADVRKLYVRAAFRTDSKQATLRWSAPGKPFSAERAVVFPVVNDGKLRTYVVDLSQASEWRGWITGLRLDPVAEGSAQASVDIQFISYRDAKK